MIEIHIEGHVSKKFDVQIETATFHYPATVEIDLDKSKLYLEATDEQLHDLYDSLQEYLHSRGRLE